MIPFIFLLMKWNCQQFNKRGRSAPLSPQKRKQKSNQPNKQKPQKCLRYVNDLGGTSGFAVLTAMTTPVFKSGCSSGCGGQRSVSQCQSLDLFTSGAWCSRQQLAFLPFLLEEMRLAGKRERVWAKDNGAKKKKKKKKGYQWKPHQISEL